MTEHGGKSIVRELTAGQGHEGPQAIPLLKRTSERMWPEAVAGNKGDRGADLRDWLLHREIEAVIPFREDERRTHDDNRERPIIDRTINRLDHVRRVATRYDKPATSDLAMVTIAMILEWPQLCRHALVVRGSDRVV